MELTGSNQLTSGFTLNHRMLYPVLVYISVLNTFRRPSFFSSTLNTEYSIFIKQNKKIIIIKQLKTAIKLIFYLNRFIMAAAETSISNPPPKHTSAGGFEIERTSS
jgi:hypothetical protein